MADDELPFRYIPPPDPNLGRRVDTYFIMRILLGKGGMGAAYLAEHEGLAHIKCVIKVVLVEMARHPMIISRYHNEAKALALLKHDNIVKLQGLGTLDDGQLYLRFEYVEGKSLDRYIAELGGRLPLRKAVNFIFQLCWALQHAHDRGVIHRDLKPDNMMIEVDPPGSHLKKRVRILDFGIAKIVSGGADVTGSGIQMGTPTYMAPEQVTNAAGVDGRADVFSLAQVLYKMVTGSLPWGSPDNSVEIYHRQPTGLASQQFAAQEPPVEVNVPQAEVAAEIEMATGTPGPLPYAHAELPAVVVSQTQLSGLTAQASAPGVSPPDHREPPPFVVLPTASNAVAHRARSVRSKLALLACACALAAVTAFAIARLRPHTTVADEPRSAAVSNDSRPSVTSVAISAPDAGMAGSPPEGAGPVSHRGASTAVDVTATASGSAASSGSAKALLPPATPQDTDPSRQDVHKDPHLHAATPSAGQAPQPTPTAQKAGSLADPPAATPGPAASKGYGELAILVKSWASLWLNGRPAGEAPYRAKIPAGRYRVRIQNEDLDKDETETVIVVPGRTTTIERNW